MDTTLTLHINERFAAQLQTAANARNLPQDDFVMALLIAAIAALNKGSIEIPRKDVA